MGLSHPRNQTLISTEGRCHLSHQGIPIFILNTIYPFSSVAQSCPTLCDTTDCRTPGFPVHHQFPKLAQTYVHHRWWCHPTIASSVTPFSSCLQSFPASVSFLRSQFFTSGGQNTGASASATVLSMNTQNWFLLGLTGWISLQSKWLSRVFSNTSVQKHQLFSAQFSWWSNSHICTYIHNYCILSIYYTISIINVIINSLVLSFLYGPILTSIHSYNHYIVSMYYYIVPVINTL